MTDAHAAHEVTHFNYPVGKGRKKVNHFRIESAFALVESSANS